MPDTNKNITSHHYSEPCGCKYTKGNPVPWLVCIDHHRSSSNNIKKHFWLYALELQDKKYYVGITAKSNPTTRIKAHGGPYGAAWTYKYPPRKILETKSLGFVTLDEAENIEHEYTLKYMEKYGYRNVRGGKITFSGNIYKFGPWFMRDYELENLGVALLLVVLGLTILFQKYNIF